MAVNTYKIHDLLVDKITLPANGTINGVIFSTTTFNAKLTANKAATVAAVATADATDLATALVLVNALKAKVNEIIAGQKTAQQML